MVRTKGFVPSIPVWPAFMRASSHSGFPAFQAVRMFGPLRHVLCLSGFTRFRFSRWDNEMFVRGFRNLLSLLHILQRCIHSLLPTAIGNPQQLVNLVGSVSVRLPAEHVQNSTTALTLSRSAI